MTSVALVTCTVPIVPIAFMAGALIKTSLIISMALWSLHSFPQPPSVIWVGDYGEMTLSKHFHRFLLDCKTYNVQINLTTNGTRMPDRWFDDLVDTLTVIGFSMEGMETEFEKIRGFKWRTFLRHVEKICQGRAARGKHSKSSGASVPMPITFINCRR